MASTPTSRIRANKQGTGDNLNVWGGVLNTQALDLFDEAVQGVETVALTGVDATLTSTNYASDQARNFGFRFTGTGGVSVIYPSIEAVKVIINASSAAITFGYSAGSGVVIAAGGGSIVAGDATTMREVARMPTAADLSALFTATSVSANAIASSGDITFTLVESNRGFAPGMLVVAAVTATPGTEQITGYVKSYSGTTLVITATGSTGSGSYSAWSISFNQATVGLPTPVGHADALLGTDGATEIWRERASQAQAQTGTDAVTWCPPVRVADAITYQALKQGQHMLPLPSPMWTPRVTAGCSSSLTETSSNKVLMASIDFDQSTQEHAQVEVALPPSFNSSASLYAEIDWGAASGSGDVIWGIQGLYLRDGDTLDTAFGTAAEVTDTLQATSKTQQTARTSGFTPGGTYGSKARLILQVYRKAAAGGDTLNADGRLFGLRLYFSVNASVDV